MSCSAIDEAAPRGIQNEFMKEQKVRSVYGEVLTVMFQSGNRVMTYEKGFYPASKVFAAHKNNETPKQFI
jgi:hypothetical protein